MAVLLSSEQIQALVASQLQELVAIRRHLHALAAQRAEGEAVQIARILFPH